ncbi:MAG: hypothetical protein KDH94_01905 [Coxiellaceae bacterium]|nr:hypothetical protein [Coxiellaceae bacterium]
MLFSLFSTSAFAITVPVDSQFEPKSYVKSSVHNVAKPRAHKAKVVAVKPTIIEPAPVVIPKKPPLEVQRLRAKKTLPYHQCQPCIYHAKPHWIHKKHSQPKKLVVTHHRPHRLVGVAVYPGSLRWNVEQIAHRYGWNRVVWALPEDYRWVGKARVNAPTVAAIFEKLLQSYPVQAQFYEGNHVLVITPRTIQ